MLRLRALLAPAAVLAILATIAGCAAPLQNGGVHVRPGAEERLDLLCRYRSSGGQQVCEPAPQAED